MTTPLTQAYPRLWSLEAGMAMVVTDLHGDGDTYRRYRDRFVDLHAGGQADYLIFTGDLIHADDPHQPDQSVDMALDVLALQASYGPAIIYLCGNHELPHIYAMTLAKGERSYTPAFEAALNQSQRRAEVLALFNALPFYLRTRAGVTITHAGAAAPYVSPGAAAQLFNWDHQSLLRWADEILSQEDIESLRQGYAKLHQAPSYQALARAYLAVSGPDDPRYNDLLRGFIAGSHPTFDELLWPALFTRCEKEYGLPDYGIFLHAMLQEVSVNFFPQQVLLAGHIPIRGGHQIIGHRHLRLASGRNATPRQAGQYLLFDTARPVKTIENLLSGLASVYR
ncbi:MAG: metallophosphoesterase [Anaerolineae bacterium]|nr:metallophosphoesterase [Anaerolineae bacterium]